MMSEHSSANFPGSSLEGCSYCGIQFLAAEEVLPNLEQNVIPEVTLTTIHVDTRSKVC